MELSRRIFLLGTALPTVALAPIFGKHTRDTLSTPLEMPEPPRVEVEAASLYSHNDSHQAVSFDAYARYLCRHVRLQLHGLRTELVGQPAGDMVGEWWGSARFDQQHYAIIPGIKLRMDGLLELDRVMVKDVARQFAERLRAENPKYFGRLPLPAGVDKSYRHTSRQHSLRFLLYHDWRTNQSSGRLDALVSTGGDARGQEG